MAFPDHLLNLATLRLLTLTPLAATYTPNTANATAAASSHQQHPQDRFHAVRSRPLRILTELTAAYLQLLGNAARSHAEQAGRTAANALDAREAIADYGGAVVEIDEWARECQLDRGILASRDAVLHDAAEGGRAEPTDLGALLKDTYYNQAYRRPTQIIEYAPLTDREAAIVDAVQRNDSLLPYLPYDMQQRVQQGYDGTTPTTPEDEDGAPSPSSSSRAISLPPPSYQEATAGTLSLRKWEKLRAHDDPSDNHDELPENDDPLSFLPPFPDLDSTQALQQTIVEDETGRIVKRARRALDANANMANLSQARKNASIAWLRAVPYETSSLAEYEGGKFSIPSIKEEEISKHGSQGGGQTNGEIDEEEDDSLTSSSLPYFLETFNWVSLDYEQQGDQALLPLRHNIKRKRAATAIHSNILNPSDDSLSGSIPALPPRHAKKQAGWIPYPPTNPDISDPSEPGGKSIRPFPYQLHPFSTQLPNSITEAVPQLVLPHSMKVLAPPMHPRYPTASTSIRTLLESSSPALFSRTTRIGPPGPLLETGAAGFYQVEQEKPLIPGWPGDALPRMMGWHFDWEIGNELEDGVNERKNAGIPNMGVHASSDARTGLASTLTSNHYLENGQLVSSSTGFKEDYSGPNFPALPVRPAHDAQRTLQQREHDRREEEAELQFQEVQEDRESENALARGLQAEQERQARAQTLLEEQARAQAAEQARLAAVERGDTEKRERLAAIQKEREQDDRKGVEQQEKVDQDRPKSMPKLSFSLKLGTPSPSVSSTAPPPTSTAHSSSVPPVEARSDMAAPINPPRGDASSFTERLQLPSQHATQRQSEVDGDSSLPSANSMWKPGAPVEQDYRAPAADITLLSQPPIVRPEVSMPVTATSPTAFPHPPIQSVVSPAGMEMAGVMSPPRYDEPALASGGELAEVEAGCGGTIQTEEGEGADEEDEDEDDLFDEVHVGDGPAEMGIDASRSDLPSLDPPTTRRENGMHIEAEEMDM